MKRFVIVALVAAFSSGCGCEKTVPSNYQRPDEEKPVSRDDAESALREKQPDFRADVADRREASSETREDAVEKNEADKGAQKDVERRKKNGQAPDSSDGDSEKADVGVKSSGNEAEGKIESGKSWSRFLPGLLKGKDVKGAKPDDATLDDIEKTLAQARKDGSKGDNERAFGLANEVAETIRQYEYAQFGSDGRGKDVDKFRRALDDAQELAKLYGEKLDGKRYQGEPQVFVF